MRREEARREGPDKSHRVGCAGRRNICSASRAPVFRHAHGTLRPGRDDNRCSPRAERHPTANSHNRVRAQSAVPALTVIAVEKAWRAASDAMAGGDRRIPRPVQVSIRHAAALRAGHACRGGSGRQHTAATCFRPTRRPTPRVGRASSPAFAKSNLAADNGKFGRSGAATDPSVEGQMALGSSVTGGSIRIRFAGGCNLTSSGRIHPKPPDAMPTQPQD